MKQATLFSNADDFEREIFRSEFDSVFKTIDLVNKRKLEQKENMF